MSWSPTSYDPEDVRPSAAFKPAVGVSQGLLQSWKDYISSYLNIAMYPSYLALLLWLRGDPKHVPNMSGHLNLWQYSCHAFAITFPIHTLSNEVEKGSPSQPSSWWPQLGQVQQYHWDEKTGTRSPWKKLTRQSYLLPPRVALSKFTKGREVLWESPVSLIKSPGIPNKSHPTLSPAHPEDKCPIHSPFTLKEAQCMVPVNKAVESEAVTPPEANQ